MRFHFQGGSELTTSTSLPISGHNMGAKVMENKLTLAKIVGLITQELTLSRWQDVLNVNSQPSTRADKMFQTSLPNHPLAPTGRSNRQFLHVKFGKLGVRRFSIIMGGKREKVFYYYGWWAWKG